MINRFDIRGRLKEYFPIFFELLGDNNLDWKTIEKRFIVKLDEHKKKYDLTGEPIRIEASLYHVITASREGKDGAAQLIDFITNIFQNLVLRLDAQEKRLIKKNLFDLLTNIDKKYLNFLGELGVLNYVKQNPKLTLIKTEYPLDPKNKNGIKIDFVFFDPKSNLDILLEVVNIHISEHQVETDEKIEILLDQKINSKLRRKGIMTIPNFYLIPVIWGLVDDIRRVIKYYEIFKPKFRNTTIPLCLVTFKDQNGDRVHKFGPIDRVLK